MTHECNSDCNNTKDCPLCEHGKLLCSTCDDPETDCDDVSTDEEVV